MSVDQTDTIDFVHLDPASNTVFLSIADQLAWHEQEAEHLLMLQEKLNTYLEYVESNQLYREFPNFKGKRIVIRVFGAHPPSDQARRFLELAKQKIEDAGFGLAFELLTHGPN
jgi:hypothetical protein